MLDFASPTGLLFALVTRQTINAIEQEKYSPTLELAFRPTLEFKLEFTEVFSFDTC